MGPKTDTNPRQNQTEFSKIFLSILRAKMDPRGSQNGPGGVLDPRLPSATPLELSPCLTSFERFALFCNSTHAVSALSVIRGLLGGVFTGPIDHDLKGPPLGPSPLKLLSSIDPRSVSETPGASLWPYGVAPGVVKKTLQKKTHKNYPTGLQKCSQNASPGSPR